MALLKAAGEGDLASLERLVSQGVDVDATDAVRATLVPPRHPRLRSVPPTALARPRPPSGSASAASSASASASASSSRGRPARSLTSRPRLPLAGCHPCNIRHIADPQSLPLIPRACWVCRSARRRSSGHPSTATRPASNISLPRARSSRRCTRGTSKELSLHLVTLQSGYQVAHEGSSCCTSICADAIGICDHCDNFAIFHIFLQCSHVTYAPLHRDGVL